MIGSWWLTEVGAAARETRDDGWLVEGVGEASDCNGGIGRGKTYLVRVCNQLWGPVFDTPEIRELASVMWVRVVG